MRSYLMLLPYLTVAMPLTSLAQKVQKVQKKNKHVIGVGFGSPRIFRYIGSAITSSSRSIDPYNFYEDHRLPIFVTYQYKLVKGYHLGVFIFNHKASFYRSIPTNNEQQLNRSTYYSRTGFGIRGSIIRGEKSQRFASAGIGFSKLENH